MITDPNLETYRDPINYDLESYCFEPDGSILLELASQASGPVLELGCGTGRVAISLATRGIDVTGLDILPHMIKHAQTKSKDLPIQWVCGDIRYFHLKNQFSLIYTYGAVFQHLFNRSDQDAMLSQVHKHLSPNGRFIVDIGFTNPKSMVDVPEEQDWYTFIDDKGCEVQVSGTDHYDHIRQIWVQTSYHRRQDIDQAQTVKPVKLALRYIMPQEMEAILFHNGFTVLSRYGDWEGKPLTESSYLQIYVCTPR